MGPRIISFGKLLLVALAAITLKGCSEGSSSSAMTSAPKEKISRRQYEAGISINGVPLAMKRARGWSPEHTAEYEAAARRFPTVEACLVSNPARAKSLTIDWTKIGSDPEAEVCLSRVAWSIGTAEGIVAWLKTHGFRVLRVKKAGVGDVSSEAIERTGTVIDGSWSIKNNGALYRRGFIAPVVQRLFGHGASVTIFLSTNKKTVSVSAGATYL